MRIGDNMEAYTGFAYVYDEYMDNIPYDEWEEYLVELLKENGIDKDNTVIDLGCGTGTVTRMLDKEGYNCIGIDLSEDMLSIASDKTYDSGQQIIYSCQDMRDFEVPYETDAFISIGDSMNYITANDDLCDVFKCVKKGLKQGGVFIFDLKTIHFFKDILADNTYAENREDSAFIWDNYYDADEKINEYDLTLFIKEQSEDEDDIYKKFEETHFQRCYEISELKELLEQSGLVFDAVYDAYTDDQVKCDSEKVTVIAHKA